MGVQQLSRTSSLSRHTAGLVSGLLSRSKYSTVRPGVGSTAGSGLGVPVTVPANRSMSESNFALGLDNDEEQHQECSLDDRLLKEKREIVAKLEKQNREIAKEIKRLRMKQAATSSNQYLDFGPYADTSDYASIVQHYQQLMQRGAANYSSIYSTATGKSREVTPASMSTAKKSIDPNLIAELRTLKVL